MIRTSTHHEGDHALGTSEPTIFVVHDNPEVRRGLIDTVRGWGYRAEPYDSGEDFMGAYDRTRPGCVIARDRLPGMTALALLGRLRAKSIQLPVIVLADSADVREAVHAMQHGAVAVLARGDHQDLHDAVRRGLRLDTEARQALWRQRELQRRLSPASPAELEVLELMIAGKANKNIARQQSVSLRTVETRRQQVFHKMEADSLAELILMVVQAKTGQALPDSLVADRPLSRVE